MVRLRNVSKRFAAGPPVLDGVSLNADRGDFITFIGPSGCGKSTLLRLVAGLTEPSSGNLTVFDRSPAEARQSMAFIFQDATLLPWLTVGKNIELPMRIRRIPPEGRRERVRRLLETVRLTGMEDRYPRQLSGGMKMRVSIARALALSPHLLLLDEPFGALDELARNRLNEELLAIRRNEAWTAFFVTHSVSEAVFLSNRIVILSANPGRVAGEVDVPFPYPRTAEIRDSASFARLAADVSRRIREIDRAGNDA